MEILLITCTILGGFAAIGYFIEKFRKKISGVDINESTSSEAKEGVELVGNNRAILEYDLFYYAKNEFLKNVSWDYATDYSKELKIGDIAGWALPSIEQLKNLRFKREELKIPAKYCYWSSERKGKNDAFYMHFDDGHLGNSPRSYHNGLCAIFIKSKQMSAGKFQLPNKQSVGLTISEVLVLDELRNKPDIFWTKTNIEESIKINRYEFQKYFSEIHSAINNLFKNGYLRIDCNNSISVTSKAIDYYRKFPRYYKKDENDEIIA